MSCRQHVSCLATQTNLVSATWKLKDVKRIEFTNRKGRHFSAGVPKLTNEEATAITVVTSVIDSAKHVCLFAEEADGDSVVSPEPKVKKFRTDVLAQNDNRCVWCVSVCSCVSMRESKNRGYGYLFSWFCV